MDQDHARLEHGHSWNLIGGICYQFASSVSVELMSATCQTYHFELHAAPDKSSSGFLGQRLRKRAIEAPIELSSDQAMAVADSRRVLGVPLRVREKLRYPPST